MTRPPSRAVVGRIGAHVLGERQVHALGVELLGLGEIEQVLEHAPAARRSRVGARELEAVAAVVDADAELPLDLPQMLVELPAHAREPPRVVGRQHDGQRRFEFRVRQATDFCVACGNETTSQAVAHGLGDDDVGELADERRRADEVDPALVLGAARELARVLLRLALDEDALHGADHAAADRGRLLVDERLQPFEPVLLDLVRQVLELGGRRSGPRAVDEAERLIEADRPNQAQRLLEVFLGLAGVADDEVRRQRDAGPHGFELLDLRDVFRGRVAALHELQHAVRAALHRASAGSSRACRRRRRPRRANP